MTIQEYFKDWSKVLDLQEVGRIAKELITVKSTKHPNVKEIFRTFNQCPLDNLKVVILGIDNIASSLEVLKDSVINYTIPHRTIIFDDSLEKWEAQGVLLLNAALPCSSGKPESINLMWKTFIRNLLTDLSEYHTGIVYLLMGTIAHSFESYIKHPFNHIIRIRHPSWYVRHRQSIPSDTWKEINSILIAKNGCGIEWFTEF